MATKIGSLIIDLALEYGLLKSGLSAAEKEIAKSTKAIKRAGADIADWGKTLSLAVTAPMIAISKSAVSGFIDQQKAMADVNAALASMGAASGKTAAELAKTADQLEMRSLFDAEVILKQVTAQLLTFGAISGKVFDRAQQAALDMAERLGAEPQAAAIMLGKALQAPAKGLTALGKTGAITQDWIAANKARIQGMLDEGRIAEAQGLILSAVEQQVAGAAAAAADATPWRKAQVAIGQAMDTIGEAILPVVTTVADAVAKMANAFNQLSPELKQTIIVIAGVAAAAGPLLIAIGALINYAAPVLAMFNGVGAAGALLTASLRNTAIAATALGAVTVALGLNFQQATSLAYGAVAGYTAYRVALVVLTQAGTIFRSVMIALEAATYRMTMAIAGATSAKAAMSSVIATLTGGLRAMFATLVANPFTAVAAAVGILAGAMITLKENQRQARQETENLISSLRALAQARSADFALKRTEADLKRSEAQDNASKAELNRAALLRGAGIDAQRYESGNLTSLERARLRGIADTLKNLNGEIGTHRLEVLELESQIKLADRAYAEAGKAAEAMAVPVAKTGAAAEGAAGKIKGLGAAAKPAADALADLMEKLYPNDVTRAQRADLNFIDKNRDKIEALGKSAIDMRMRVLGIDRKAEVSKSVTASEPLYEAERVRDAIDRMTDGLTGFGKKAKTQSVQIAESFRDMADKTVQAFDRMASALKGGGFLDILGAGINLFLQLGSTGLFGKTLAANINAPRIPGNANGTAFHPGGLMQVGERGAEILQVPRGGRVIPNHELRQAGAQRLQVEVVANNNGFGAMVRNAAGQVVAEAAPSLMAGSAQVTTAQLAQRQSRRIGR